MDETSKKTMGKMPIMKVSGKRKKYPPWNTTPRSPVLERSRKIITTTRRGSITVSDVWFTPDMGTI